MLAVLYAASGIELRRLEPDFVHEYAFMTSADAPMTRVTRRFFEHCEAFFARHQDDFRLQQSRR